MLNFTRRLEAFNLAADMEFNTKILSHNQSVSLHIKFYFAKKMLFTS